MCIVSGTVNVLGGRSSVSGRVSPLTSYQLLFLLRLSIAVALLCSRFLSRHSLARSAALLGAGVVAYGLPLGLPVGFLAMLFS